MNDKRTKLNLPAIIACLVVMFSIGLVYMWSVFQQPVMNHYGWEASSVSMISSAMIMMVVTGIFTGGIIQDHFGPRIVVTIGGILNQDGSITGNYTVSFVVAAAVCVIPLVCMLVYDKVPLKPSHKQIIISH